MDMRFNLNVFYSAALAAAVAVSLTTPASADKPGVRTPDIDISTRADQPVRVDINTGTSNASNGYGATTNSITSGQTTTSSSMNIAGNPFPNRPLPRDTRTQEPTIDPATETMPVATGPHTQLGIRDGRHETYNQAREFDANGQAVRDIDFTNHGRPDTHSNPHQHKYLENPSGGTPQRGPAEPLN